MTRLSLISGGVAGGIGGLAGFLSFSWYPGAWAHERKLLLIVCLLHAVVMTVLLGIHSKGELNLSTAAGAVRVLLVIAFGGAAALLLLVFSLYPVLVLLITGRAWIIAGAATLGYAAFADRLRHSAALQRPSIEPSR